MPSYHFATVLLPILLPTGIA